MLFVPLSVVTSRTMLFFRFLGLGLRDIVDEMRVVLKSLLIWKEDKHSQPEAFGNSGPNQSLLQLISR